MAVREAPEAEAGPGCGREAWCGAETAARPATRRSRARSRAGTVEGSTWLSTALAPERALMSVWGRLAHVRVQFVSLVNVL